MKIAIYLLFMLALCSCGGADAEISPPLPPRIVVDSSYEEYLKIEFGETKQCTGLEKGTFADLQVIVMPPHFPCSFYRDGCMGEFEPPYFIKIADNSWWKHEVIHYLLNLNTNDSDPGHVSKFFNTCTL